MPEDDSTGYFGAPRRVLALIALACVAMLAFGLYLQHVVGPGAVPDVHRAALCAGAGGAVRRPGGALQRPQRPAGRGRVLAC